MLPHRLDEGLYLEQSGQLVAWQGGLPRIDRWTDETVFGGVACRSLSVSVDEARWFSLGLDVDRGYASAKGPHAVIEVHRRGVEALSVALGPPEVYSEGWIQRPSKPRLGIFPGRSRGLAEPHATWTLGDVTVRRAVSDKMGMIWFTRICRG